MAAARPNRPTRPVRLPRTSRRAVRFCEVCGAAPPAGRPYSAVLPGRGQGPGGVRLLVACGAEHLAALLADRRQQPCTPEELWIGQLCAVLRLAGREPTPEELRQAGGPGVERIDRVLRAVRRRGPAGPWALLGVAGEG